MNMVKFRFVLFILLLQVVNAENTKGSQGGDSNPENSDMQGCNRCGKISSTSTKVIDGEPVEPKDKYPWVVPLFIRNKNSCGGALISAKYVMTAGHCLIDKNMKNRQECKKRGHPKKCYYKPNVLKVGISGSKEAIRRVIEHKNFYNEAFMYDIALLQLASPVRCSATVMPICLPTKDFHEIGKKLITAGWGVNKPKGQDGPQKLREGSVKEINPRSCLRDNQPKNYHGKLVCVTGKQTEQSSCYGDSGTALFGEFENKFYAVGVVSYGGHDNNGDCDVRRPGAYFKVYEGLNFIKEYVKDLPRD